MVFCGIYPADGAKLSATCGTPWKNCSSTTPPFPLSRKPPWRLGFGFRCGFLGLLHMEIIQERLEREFNLDLITTAPSVIYKLHHDRRWRPSTSTTPPITRIPALIARGGGADGESAASSPRPSTSASLWSCARSGAGVYKDTKYLDTDRVELHYDLPLNEIVYDFFDALKSRTKGYASYDYELDGYQPSKLVKLDILLNGEMVDALSFIVHADKAYARARKMCGKPEREYSAPAV